MPRDFDAFISYTRQQGGPVAERVLELLRAERFKVWQDRTHMRGGEDFWRQIEAAIERVPYVIMVLTADAFGEERRVLRDEWLTARRRGCRILPVVAGGSVDFSDPAMPAWLGKLDCYDVDNANHRAKLANDLRTTPEPRPVPHHAAYPAHFVPREREMREIAAALTAPINGARVALTTALRGAGRFGKTTLAKAVCFDDDVLARYTDGVLWVTVGEETRTRAELLAALLAQLGLTVQSADPDTVAGAWREALRTRQCLVVLDDVWQPADARALVADDTTSAFLITTRIPRVATEVDARDCIVDEMTPAEAAGVLAALAERASFWPVLLGLFAGQLRHTLRRPGASPLRAVDQLEEDLRDGGLTAFDRATPAARSDAVAATIEVSLRYLEQENPGARELKISGALGRELVVGSASSDSPLLPGRGQRPATLSDVGAAFLYAAHDAGIERPSEVTPAALRHTYLAFLVRQRIRFADLARLVGAIPPEELTAYGALTPAGPRVTLDAIELVLPALRSPEPDRSGPA